MLVCPKCFPEFAELRKVKFDALKFRVNFASILDSEIFISHCQPKENSFLSKLQLTIF